MVHSDRPKHTYLSPVENRESKTAHIEKTPTIQSEKQLNAETTRAEMSSPQEISVTVITRRDNDDIGENNNSTSQDKDDAHCNASPMGGGVWWLLGTSFL